MQTRAVFPIVVERDAFYTQEQLKSLSGLSIRSIGDACRAGQLRFTERAGKRFFRGISIIEWLDGSPSTDSQSTDQSRHNTEPALA